MKITLAIEPVLVGLFCVSLAGSCGRSRGGAAAGPGELPVEKRGRGETGAGRSGEDMPPQGAGSGVRARPSTLRTRSSARPILTLRSEGEGSRTPRRTRRSTSRPSACRCRAEDDQIELMQVYEGLNQFDNAIAAACLGAGRDPDNREALAGMSRLMVETGRSGEAIRFADKLMELDPGMKEQALKASALLAAPASRMRRRCCGR